MDSLPPEIVRQIVSNAPKSSLASCRLVCRMFDSFAFPILFSYIPHWLDYKTSHQAVLSLVHDVYNRPAVMWSPWASEPDLPVDNIFMGIIWKLLVKTDPPGFSLPKEESGGTMGIDQVQLTPQNFAELSGRDEMTENRLKTAQNRFLLHRNYSEKFDWNGAKL
ncbi:hypothetical protein N431DRAFT_329652 [Stipitochalara longipes BDJ]|nr:hypothetical protein N431DRAFT_329652 [Stipitochalara longipes BDJ]